MTHVPQCVACRAPGRAALALALLLASAAPGAVQAQQPADEVLSTVRRRFEERARSVDNYSVVQEIDGARQVAYYERQERDGHPVFVAVGPFKTLMEGGLVDAMLGGGVGNGSAGGSSGGGVLGTLRSALARSAGSAGLSELQQQVQGIGDGAFADFIGPLLTPEPGQAPDAALASLTSGEHLKAALLEGAKNAALHQVERSLLNAAAPQLGALLQALDASDGGGQTLRELGGMVARGQLPMPGQLFENRAMAGPADGPSMGMGGPSGLMNGAAAAAGVFMMKKVAGAGDAVETSAPMARLDPTPGAMFDDLAGRMTLAGREDVDGHDCWVLSSDGADALADEVPDEVRNPKVTVWIDRALSVPRRFRMEAEVKAEGAWTPMVMETHHDDFRDVHGLLLPYHTLSSISGMSATLSSDKQDEMRKGMAEMQKQLDAMPPEQRAMAERMLRSRMPEMQAMLGRSGEPMETVVKDVEVNQGPPEELVAEAQAMMNQGR